MVLTSVAPLPTLLDRFRAAWRGDESLAWVFWCFYLLGGFAVAAILVALLGVLQPIAGGGIDGFAATPIGQAYILTSDLVFLGYFAIAFILIVRCIANVKWKGWQYVAMVYLLGVAHQLVEQARDIGATIFG